MTKKIPKQEPSTATGPSAALTAGADELDVADVSGGALVSSKKRKHK
jgi:hypothetical protein